MVGLARQIIEAEDQGIEIDPDLGALLASLVLAQAEWRATGGFSPSWKEALRGEPQA